MKLSTNHLDAYLESIGMTREELSGIRIVDYSKKKFVTFELDFTNVWGVTYTRVASVRADDSCKLEFKSITSKTRLHVPIGEIPDGAHVYLQDGTGPLLMNGPCVLGGTILYLLYEGQTHVATLTSRERVSIEFYYVRGVGMVAGGLEMTKTGDIISWAVKNMPLVKSGRRIEALVDGCKFDLWAACCAIRGIESVFDMPTKGE